MLSNITLRMYDICINGIFVVTLLEQ